MDTDKTTAAREMDDEERAEAYLGDVSIWASLAMRDICKQYFLAGLRKGRRLEREEAARDG